MTLGDARPFEIVSTERNFRPRFIMGYFLATLLVLAWTAAVRLEADEPAKPAANPPEPEALTKLREAHDAAVKKAVTSLREDYLKDLDKMLDAALSAGQSEAAAAISEELKKAATVLKEGGAPLPPLVHLENPLPIQDAVLIPPNTPAGFSLGPLKTGAKIELQYTFGKWKSWGSLSQYNPDDPAPQERGDASRLVLAESPKNGVPGDIIQMIPTGTKDKPFTFTFPKDYPNGVCLRIRDNSTRDANPGEVFYKVKLVK
jgi:hypothetical protein